MSANLLVTMIIAAGLAGGCLLLLVTADNFKRWAMAGTFACAIITFGLLHRAQWHALYSDAPFHLSLLRAAADDGAFPADPFFAGFPAPLHYSLLHLLGGILVRFAGSVETAWFLLGQIYLTTAVIVGYRLGRMLFAGQGPACAGALLFACLALTGIVPAFAGTASLLVLAALTLIPVDDTARLNHRRPVLIGLLLGAAMAVRLFTGGMGFVAVLICVATCRVLPPRQRRRIVWIACVSALVTAAPWLLAATQMEGVGNEIISGTVATQSFAAAYAGDLARSLDASFLHVPFSGLKLVHAVLQVVALAVLFHFRQTAGNWRLIARFGVTVATMFFLPWRWLMLSAGMAEDLVGRMLYIVGRVSNLFPAALCFTILLGATWQSSQTWRWLCERRNFHRALVMGVLFAGLAVALFPVAVRLRLMFEYGTAVQPRFAYLYAGKPAEVFKRLQGKTLLSDAWSSYMTQYALQTRVVSVPVGHSSGRVCVKERSSEIKELFSGQLSAEEAHGMLSRYQVDFVMLNVPLATGQTVPFFNLEAMEYNALDLEALHSLPMLRLAYEDGDVVLFEVVEGGGN